MIVLASQSSSRKAMLQAAGVAFEAFPAALDERLVEERLGNAPPESIALALADAKALAVSRKTRGGRLILGSDSLVVVSGRRFNKPTSREDAAAHLRFFSGRQMQLFSAASLVRDDRVIWNVCAEAVLHVRPLSDHFIASYLDEEWPEVAGCVGVFRIEAMGAQLFERIEGDQFTVFGMPLLPVLEALRIERELIA